jgi:hypothetical protein
MDEFGVEETLLARLRRSSARFKSLDALEICWVFVNSRGTKGPCGHGNEGSDCQ